MVVIGSRARPRRRILTWVILLLGIVVILLAIVNLGIVLIRNGDRPALPSPGQLLYATTFSNFNQEWAQFDGQQIAKISDGALHVSINNPGAGAYSDLDHEFSDFDLRVTATWIAAPSDLSQISILFRYGSDHKNFYVFRLSADGAYSVEVVKDTVTEILSGRQITPAALTIGNAINQIRIIGAGSHFRFMVNDQLLPLCLKGTDKKPTWSDDHSGKCVSNGQHTVNELIDESLPYGKIGLGVYTDDPGAQVAFTNVLIYGPDDKPGK